MGSSNRTTSESRWAPWVEAMSRSTPPAPIGGELLVVADQPHPRTGPRAGGDDPVEGGGVGHPGLVDHHDRVGPEPGIQAGGEGVVEHRERLGGDAGRLGQDRGCCR